MKAGYFLGIADTVGDAFTYYILPEKWLNNKRRRHKHLVRSVVRLRDPDNKTILPCTEEKADSLKFFYSSGVELDGDTVLEESPTEEVNDSSVDSNITDDDNDIMSISSDTSQMTSESYDLLHSDIPLLSHLKRVTPHNPTPKPNEMNDAEDASNHNKRKHDTIDYENINNIISQTQSQSDDMTADTDDLTI